MHKHFIIHKPYNCLSQFIFEGKRKTNKHLLGELYEFPKGTMAIGRLDEKSEGLLFLTTDGKLSEEIRSSKYEKEYYVQVDGIVSEKIITELENGVEIGFDGKKYITQPCKARIIEAPNFIYFEKKEVRNENHGPLSWLSLTITEGKFRQVRKMTAKVGHATFRLIRVRIGKIKLELKAGEIEEVISLI